MVYNLTIAKMGSSRLFSRPQRAAGRCEAAAHGAELVPERRGESRADAPVSGQKAGRMAKKEWYRERQRLPSLCGRRASI